MKRRLKDILWPIYRCTGPLNSLALRVQLIQDHGTTAGTLKYRQLPPGTLEPADEEFRRDQQYFLNRSRQYGNVFKCQMGRMLMIVLIGNKRGMKFITENEGQLTGAGPDLERLFADGHLRRMKGEKHRGCRRALVYAMRTEVVAACDTEIRSLVRTGLRELARSHCSNPIPTAAIMSSLRSITTRSLLRIALGIDPRGAQADQLTERYNKFSNGYAPAYDYGEKEAKIFGEIRSIVNALARDLSGGPEREIPVSIFSQLVGGGESDDSVIGNLLYMIESGRFDATSLLRWVIKYLAENPALVSRVKEASNGATSDPSTLSVAVVTETLRCNQSEAVTRYLSSDTEFDGFFLPAGSRVRICLWEQHKDANVFPQPFRFDPDRFLSQSYPLDEYAPFGLDRHRCIAADLALRLSAIFVEEMCKNFLLENAGDGDPVRGAYHWEPSRDFAIHLVPTQAA